ncbi:hypothetical protein ACFSSA_15145 [Luteolibacter algae]|uniref:Uncharacterized protein n=1 Tax=Luteolibacter algae TaxID=454151 RepID=A0ABW5DC42_9BACT
MSLRGFHIVFVTVCTLLFAFLLTWALALAPERSALTNSMGFIGAAGLLFMPVYGVYFLKKAAKLHL